MSVVSRYLAIGLLSLAASAAAYAQHAGHSMSQAPQSRASQQQSDAEHQEHGETSIDSSSADHGPMHSGVDTVSSEREHIPPAPPQHEPPDMSSDKMIELMEMDDTAPRSMFLANPLEYASAQDNDALRWDVLGWFGNDYTKLLAKSEGTHTGADTDARNELLIDRVIGRHWSLQGGARYDVREAVDRTWAAIGMQGIAPYWFEIESTLYVGDAGRLAARFNVDYDMLLTQRLILQPQFEVNAYSKTDAQNRIGSGVSETELGLRLRYELRRELAPYIGLLWRRAYGETADLERAAGSDPDDVEFIAGVRFWY